MYPYDKRRTPYSKFKTLKAIFDRILFDFMPFDRKRTKINPYKKKTK